MAHKYDDFNLLNGTGANAKVRSWINVSKDIIAALGAVDGELYTHEQSVASASTASHVKVFDTFDGATGDFSYSAAATTETAVAASPRLVKAAAEAAAADAVATVTSQMSSLVSSVFQFKGTVTSVSALADISEKREGDVYNISTGDAVGGAGPEANDGMNYVWTGSSWDALGGTWTVLQNMSGTYASAASAVSAAAVASYVASEIDSSLTVLQSDVATLKTEVEAETTGLLDRVSVLETTTIPAIDTRVSALETTVGDSNSGLVADVASNTSRIAALETSNQYVSVSTVVSGETSTTITKTTDPNFQVFETAGTFTLNTTAASSTEFSTKYVHLHAAEATTLTLSSPAVWADSSEGPTWGSAGKNLFLRIDFIYGRVIVSVIDNDQEAANAVIA